MLHVVIIYFIIDYTYHICIMTSGLEVMDMESDSWVLNLCHRALHSVQSVCTWFNALLLQC